MHGLLLAAFEPELADFIESPPPGWKPSCTGVGAIAAAATTARLLVETRPNRVLFLGTCGTCDEQLGIGAILSVREVIATSLDELEGRSYRPGIERTRWTANWMLPFPAQAVVVPPAITRTEGGARLLAALAPAEHLELSGVFEACRAAQVPVAAALVVVNRVGPQAHAEWEANHVQGSRALAAAVRIALNQIP